MQKLLSIVIANYNYGRYLEDAIRSVFEQADERVELIIVDGGSTDNSVEIIKKYQDKISWWCSEKDGGQSAAFNKGFARAQGKYLTWLNADDVLVAGCLKTVLEKMERHPDCQWFTGNFFRFTADGRIVGIGWGPHCYPAIMQRRNSPKVVYGPTSFFSKRIYLECGKIDERIHYIMDNDLWNRFILHGVKLRRIRCFCWAFRMHEESKTAEFDGHVLAPGIHEKMDAEGRYSAAKTGYKRSLALYYVILAWRVLDGSLARNIYYKLFFKHVPDEMVFNVLRHG